MLRSKVAEIHKSKWLVFLTSFAVSLLLISATAHSGVLTPFKEKTNVSSLAQARNNHQLEVEVITITPGGFEPQQIERPAGPFLLSVTNRSGVDSLNVHVETEQHNSFRERSLPLRTPYWREVIDPPPGRYIVTEATHPEWILTFIIK